MPIGVGGAILAGGALSAGSSLLGSGKASSAAKDAANQAQQRYLQTRADLQPFTGIGTTAAGNALTLAQGGTPDGQPNYLNMAGALFPGGLPGSAGATGTPGGGMTQAELEATPGYQFTRDQGLKAVQSAAAARGLGMSGASMKGAATYATGLADSTYTNQFNIAQQKFNDALNASTQQFNRYNSLATLGENAAAGTGTIGASLANTSANYTNQAGLAQAAGGTGAGNALTGAANSYLGYQNFQQLMDRFAPQTGTSGYTPTTPTGPVAGAGGDPFYGNTM